MALRGLIRAFGCKVGDTFSVQRAFTAANVQVYGDLIDDHNAVHFSDAKAAATGLFTGRIAHGMLVSSLFSHLLAAHYPGAIYMSQSLKFTKPVYLEELVEGRVTVKSTHETKKGVRCVLGTTVTKVKDSTLAVDGEATILLLSSSKPSP